MMHGCCASPQHAMHVSVSCPSYAANSHTVQGTYAKVKYGQHVQTGEVVAIKVKTVPQVMPWRCIPYLQVMILLKDTDSGMGALAQWSVCMHGGKLAGWIRLGSRSAA